jgi:hypothetical protein
MEFREIMKETSFRRLAAFLRVASSSQWHHAHDANKFRFYYDNFVRLVQSYHKDLISDIIGAFSGMVSEAVMADVYLAHYYTTDELDWLLKVLDGENPGVILMMLLAVSATPEEYITPVRAAELTGKSESGFRNRANAGQIPNAKKEGKQWLIPQSWIDFGEND